MRRKKLFGSRRDKMQKTFLFSLGPLARGVASGGCSWSKKPFVAYVGAGGLRSPNGAFVGGRRSVRARPGGVPRCDQWGVFPTKKKPFVAYVGTGGLRWAIGAFVGVGAGRRRLGKLTCCFIEGPPVSFPTPRGSLNGRLFSMLGNERPFKLSEPSLGVGAGVTSS